MATRVVSVALVADVGGYISPVTRAAAATKGLGTTAEATGARTHRGFDLAGKGALTLGAGAGAAAIGLKSAIGAASDLSETLNKSNVIFGDNAGEIRRWAETSARDFGLSEAAALEAAAGFGNMLQQLGYTGDEAVTASTDVVQLAADLGSFNNLETGDVLDRISAAMRGEYDSLQLLIPNINAARVETEALTMTGKENKDALTAQEKAAAVLAIVNRDGAAAANDFAETSGGLANATKIAKAEFENLQAEIGTRFLPIAADAMGFVSGTVLPVLGSFADTVFGVVEGFLSLPGPVQAAAGAMGALALLNGPLSGVLGTVKGFAGGLFTGAAGTVGAFSEALGYARANGDGLHTVLRSAGSYVAGGFKTAMSNVMGMLGGPWGLAMIAATATVGMFVSAIKEATAQEQEWADGLVAGGKAATDAIAGMAAERAKYGDNWLGDLSYNVDQFFGLASSADEARKKARELWQEMDPLAQAQAKVAEWTATVRDRLYEYGPAAEETRIAQERLAFWSGEAASRQSELDAATGQATDTTVEAVDPIAAYKAELEAAAAAADEAKKQTDLFKLSLDILSGATVSMIEVESAFQAAIDEATGAMEGLDGSVMNAEGSLNLNSEAGRRASDVLLDVRNRGNDLIATMIQQEASTDEVTAADRELRESFIESARQMGISEDAALNLADQILGIPSERETTITADTSQASRAVETFVAGVTGKSIVLTGDFVGGAGINVRRATGGSVFGPGTETSDSIPALLSNNEHVWTAAEVRGAGGHSAVEQMRVAARSGNLATFAAGGAVLADRYAIPATLTGLPDPAKISVGGIPGSGGSLSGGSTMSARLYLTTKAAFPEARLNSGYRAGDPGYHGLNRAADLGQVGRSGGNGHPYLAAMNRWWFDKFGSQLAELIYDGAGDDRADIKNGRPHTYNAATRAQHKNHVHIAMANGGVIGEPVAGVGMWSGGSYSFGERGPETVLPGVHSREFSGTGSQPAAPVVVQMPSLEGLAVEGRIVVDSGGLMHFVDGRLAQRDAARGRDWRSARG